MDTHSLVRALRCFSLWVSMAPISLTSRYSSDVSAGIPLGISVSLAWEQRTMVPVQVHSGGQ